METVLTIWISIWNNGNEFTVTGDADHKQERSNCKNPWAQPNRQQRILSIDDNIIDDYNVEMYKILPLKQSINSVFHIAQCDISHPLGTHTLRVIKLNFLSDATSTDACHGSSCFFSLTISFSTSGAQPTNLDGSSFCFLQGRLSVALFLMQFSKRDSGFSPKVGKRTTYPREHIFWYLLELIALYNQL